MFRCCCSHGLMVAKYLDVAVAMGYWLQNVYMVAIARLMVVKCLDGCISQVIGC